MFSNLAIDVALGLVFIFLLYSLFVTILQEMIARVFSLRARTLSKALRRMLDGDPRRNDLGFFGRFTLFTWFYERGWSVVHFFFPFKYSPILQQFYATSSIRYLGENTAASRPSYISPAIFSQTMVHLLRNSTTARNTDQQTIQAALDENSLHFNDATLTYIRNIFTDAGGNTDRFRALLEDWFNETMSRASSWYRKHTQSWLLIIGFCIAGIFNVDTIAIARILMKDKTVRQEMVQLASSRSYAMAPIVDTLQQKHVMYKDSAFFRQDSSLRVFVGDTSVIGVYAMLRADAGDARNVLGIHREFSAAHPYGLSHPLQQNGWIVLAGWLMTAMAISLGAPFWFDLLGKVVKFRNTPADNSAGSMPSKP
ncbi:hypothetical protein [Chitinophaga sp. Cy-1792]|uniref:hypothetical protein n=1 Tax=Chitinophaga sp. Cy-1792 TaxID=2608339 RepID=UPI00141F29EC|nr:hypothetical protein [Chitinophaga sp. Cy-1792]NIG53949.1 hypothetical protein [Chitinophaga sp. Cy-1792]